MSQVFFSSKIVSSHVEEVLLKSKLKEKGIEVSFSKASATFVGSFSHPIGIRIRGLNLSFVSSCKKYELKSETLVLPFHLKKLINNKISLGLLRLSDADFQVEENCGSKAVASSERKKRAKKSKKSLEGKILKFVQKIQKSNLLPLKNKESEFKYAGLLIYDLKIPFKGGYYFIQRFKTLFGSGDVEAKGEWRSSLSFENTKEASGKKPSKIDVRGEFSYAKELIKSEITLKEKESLIDIKLSIPRVKTDLVRKETQALVSLKTVPLSFFSKLQKLKLAGLNLRKTWVDADFSLGVNKDSLYLRPEGFKAYGDFGSVEMGHSQPLFKWTAFSDWVLKEKTQFKFHDIDFFNVLSLNPQKKVSHFFGDFGKFDASVDLKSMKLFEGDFETKNFSILVRSMGKKVYQKVSFARGSLRFSNDKMLSFSLEEMGLENGDFEGFIKFDYDYATKEIKTNFDLTHLRFDPKITKQLFQVDVAGNLKLEGRGFISKSKLTRKNSKDFAGSLNFEISSEGLAAKHWGLKKIATKCVMKQSDLGCDLNIGKLFLSEKLTDKLSLQEQNFSNLMSKTFAFKDKNLELKLSNRQSDFNFQWSRKKGLLLTSPVSKETVSLRALD